MEESFRRRWFWGVAVPLAAATLAALLFAAGYLVPENAEPASRELLLHEWQLLKADRPEPLEHLRYLLAISSVPLIFCLAGIAAGRAAAGRLGRWLQTGTGTAWVLAVQVLAAAFVAAMLYLQHTRVFAYFRPGNLQRGLLLGTALVLAWVCCPLRWKGRVAGVLGGPGLPGRFGQWLRWRAPFWVALGATAVGLLPCLLGERSWEYNPHAACRDNTIFHLSLVMNEFAAVLNGRTLRVDFFPQYQGLLAYFLTPLFRVTGLTVAAYTAATTALSGLGLLLLYGVLRRLAGDPWKALFLYVPLLATGVLSVRLDPPHVYARLNAFTYPLVGAVRYLGPWLTAALLAWYLQRPSIGRAVMLFFAAGLAALNNLDFGLPALAGAVAGVLFAEVRGAFPDRRSVAHAAGGVALGLSLAVCSFLLITFLRSGRLPDFASLVFFQRAFATYGFGMLPMPPYGLHWVFYVTFMAAVACGLFTPPESRSSRGLLLFAGVFGSGAMMYYVGRSHPHCLLMVFPAWAFAFALLVWSAWTDFGLAEGRLLRLVPALLIATGYLLCVACIDQIPNPVREVRRLATLRAVPPGHHRPAVDLVRAHTRPGEPVGVICPYGFVLANDSGVENVFPFAQIESLFFRSQLDTILDRFERAGVRHVFGTITFAELYIELERRGFRLTIDPGTGMMLWER